MQFHSARRGAPLPRRQPGQEPDGEQSRYEDKTHCFFIICLLPCSLFYGLYALGCEGRGNKSIILYRFPAVCDILACHSSESRNAHIWTPNR